MMTEHDERRMEEVAGMVDDPGARYDVPEVERGQVLAEPWYFVQETARERWERRQDAESFYGFGRFAGREVMLRGTHDENVEQMVRETGGDVGWTCVSGEGADAILEHNGKVRYAPEEEAA